MAISQTMLFTVMPRSLQVNPERLAVSVFVSPRLYSAEPRDMLGAFADWANWTARIQDQGMRLQFLAGGRSFEARIDPKPLRPDLWHALFKQDTLVRSHVFNDNTDKGVFSYSVRDALSVIKSLYQEASVSLALPDDNEGQAKERGKRRLLGQLVDGLDVHWDDARAKEWRAQLAHPGQFASRATHSNRAALDAEGLRIAQPDQSSHRQVAIPFATFHHLPQIAAEKPEPLKPDTNTDLDFHQALASLNSYPELLRALGLVFDFDLALDLIPESAAGGYSTISVTQVGVGWEWSLPTTIPALESAYIHTHVGANFRVFCPAPRVMYEKSFDTQVLGLLNLDPARFGIAQIDIDGAMHKAIMLAEIMHPEQGQNLRDDAELEAAQHPMIYDADATLPALRSGGLQIYADERATKLLDMFSQNKTFNSAIEQNGAQPRPFFAEDLLRGYRLDVWDSQTREWHSLHQRSGEYLIGDDQVAFTTSSEEGFTQLAATKAVADAQDATDDFYLHEAVARWAGWSLSAPMPGKALSKHGDPEKAIPQDGDPEYAMDESVTPYKIQATYRVIPGSLPRLRFGVRYRIRARAVDLCGNSMRVDDQFTNALAVGMAIPRDLEGMAYLRYEPVISPQIILRDTRSVTDPGSQLDRLVIRSFNSSQSLDRIAADLTASDRHLVPPRATVEIAERHALFDDATGKLQADAGTYQLIVQRDAGEFNQTTTEVAGQQKQFPLEPADILTLMPHLPDPLARGVALRNLPGTPNASLGHATGAGMLAPVAYQELSDPNPRPGSATLVPFGADDRDPAWQQLQGIRLILSEPQPDQPDTPQWDPAARTLTVFLGKGQTAVVPLSSYMNSSDLKQMGMWQWLREHIERITIVEPRQQYLQPGRAVDEIAHILQRAVEGGHWMLTPPRLLTLVHAVQQPIGQPAFRALQIAHEPLGPYHIPLQAAISQGRADESELAAISAWRRLNATDAFLLGALQIHGVSTARIDITASWEDPVDDPLQPEPGSIRQQSHVDTISLPDTREQSLYAAGTTYREVGYYDPEHDQIVFARGGNRMGDPKENLHVFGMDAAPRHILNDTRRHRVLYSATAASRYQEYFAQDQDLVFTRSSDPVLVDVPASARPLAPSVQYVLPTFGWQRQTDTNMQRSVRFGGGLRVYLDRPWYSSGEGELLGVALYSNQDGALDDTKRRKWGPYITQWGMDPIWQTAGLAGYPHIGNFPDSQEHDTDVSLEEATIRTASGEPGIVDVVGYPVLFDKERKLWYSDLTINLSNTYAPFVRLALVRYQPHALPDARISRVVLADFAQLTPDRSAMISADPHHPRQIRVVVSGIAPRGPSPNPAASVPPTKVRVRVQQRDPKIATDLGWLDAPATVARVQDASGTASNQPDLALFLGLVTFAQRPEPGMFRLVIEEYEQIAADAPRVSGRMIYAEVFEIDAAMLS